MGTPVRGMPCFLPKPQNKAGAHEQQHPEHVVQTRVDLLDAEAERHRQSKQCCERREDIDNVTGQPSLIRPYGEHSSGVTGTGTPWSMSVMGTLSDQQNGAGRMVGHGVGNTAQKEPADSRPDSGSHQNEIGPAFRGFLKNRCSRGPYGNFPACLVRG